MNPSTTGAGSDAYATSALGMIVLGAIFVIVFFLVIRRFWWWYWGVTKIHQLQERQAVALEQIRDTVARAAADQRGQGK